MPGKKKVRNEESGSHYYVSVDGSRKNTGTMDSPWSLSHAVRGAGERLLPGDIVCVRGGIYHSKTGINITASGTALHPVIFKPCPGETVLLDGSIPEFTTIGNTAWEPYGRQAPGHNVYRSVNPFPLAESYGGFIEIGGEMLSLAPHKVHTYLLSDTHVWVKGKARYLGPGIAQDKTPNSPDFKHLFIRLDPSTAKAQLDRPVPQVSDPDPRHHAIYIGSKASFGIKISGSHLVIENFTQINHFGSCFLMNTPGQTDVTIRNCGGRPIFFGVRCGAIDRLILESCKFYAHMPSDTWWVSYADIKVVERDPDGKSLKGEPPADHVRKVALDLGRASHVEVVNCVFEEFFDGILAKAAKLAPDGSILESPAHHVQIQSTLFQHIWDDAWQMAGDLYQINFHHNFCLGAGPSVNVPGTNHANQDPGTVYIHHNVIDTTTRRLFWGRSGAPGAGSFESIPLPSHGVPTLYTWPRKLYYNTIVTGRTISPHHPYVGWALSGAAAANSQATHEVYNNIFLVIDGRPGGRNFDATSGREIYDGNVYWHYRAGSPSRYKSPWLFLKMSPDEEPVKEAFKTVTELKNSAAFIASKAYYAPGWENSGLSVSPQINRAYEPRAVSCQTGAVKLTKTGWPGTYPYEAWRGAVKP